MINKKIVSIITISFFFILASSGCLDFILDGSTLYQSHPTKISYNITYGYEIDCTGTGKYEINYNCDKPDLLSGTVYSVNLLYTSEYQNIQLADNNVVFWNISGKGNNNYKLGISAIIQAESFLVTDLNGEGALTIQEINTNHSDLVNQYCHEQSVEGKNYIEPNYAGIQNTANAIKNQANSSNSFTLAKALFVWLKENTQYKLHGGQSGVQLARTTYLLKTGDCDDLSFLYISLCRSLGIPARFIRGYLLVDNNGNADAGPHAWTEVFVGGDIGNDGWIPVECACSASSDTEIHQNFALEDAYHLRMFVDDGSDESINHTMSSISWTYTNADVTANSFIEIEDYTVLEEKQLKITKDNIRSYQ